jgi:hypothetical protein
MERLTVSFAVKCPSVTKTPNLDETNVLFGAMIRRPDLLLPLLHAVTITIAGIVIVASRGSLTPLCFRSPLLRITLGLDIVYYAYEATQATQRVILLHHVSLSFLYLAWLVAPNVCKGDVYLAHLLLMNASNVPMHAGRVFPLLRRVCSVVFVPLFICSRFLVFPMLLSVFAASRGGLSMFAAFQMMRVECVITSAGILTFNVYLFCTVLRRMS